MRSVPLSRNLSLALAVSFTVACGGPAVVPPPPLADGDGPLRLRFNQPPVLAGNPDLYFEVAGPGGWERISLENPDDELDLLAMLMAEAEASPLAVFLVEGTIRPDTRAYGDHTARVFRLTAIPSAAPVAPARDPPSMPGSDAAPP